MVTYDLKIFLHSTNAISHFLSLKLCHPSSPGLASDRRGDQRKEVRAFPWHLLKKDSSRSMEYKKAMYKKRAFDQTWYVLGWEGFKIVSSRCKTVQKCHDIFKLNYIFFSSTFLYSLGMGVSVIKCHEISRKKCRALQCIIDNYTWSEDNIRVRKPSIYFDNILIALSLKLLG